jgi:periplasmic divalent cation tolerance protein
VSPYPLEPAEARGPMRLVLTTFPDSGAAARVAERILTARLAACATSFPVDSRYWWQGRLESAHETLVLFKTAPKKVGALFRELAEQHPYDVPEIVEIDLPRVHPPYLRYLAETVDTDSPPAPLGGGSIPSRVIRRGGPRAPGAARPGRTRARPRHRSTRSRTPR